MVLYGGLDIDRRIHAVPALRGHSQMIFVTLSVILTLRGEGLTLIVVHVTNFLERRLL